jgi:ribonuclease P protein component
MSGGPVDEAAVGSSGRQHAHRLPRSARITGSDEIRSLLRRGKRRKTRHLDVFVFASPVAHSRLGLIVPKPRRKTSPDGRRVHGASVQRNRLKRRLREIGRIELLPRLACGADILIRARPEAYGAPFDMLRSELIALEDWICSSVL